MTSKEEYKVLNYSPSPVCVRLPNNFERLLPGGSLEMPYTEFFTVRDIEYMNANSTVFRDGILEFEDVDADELYKHLHIPNWQETVLRETQIDEILLNPTRENMQKIIDVRTPMMIDRFRGHLIKLGRDPQYDVSTRVEELVEARFQEIRNDVYRTKLVVNVPTAVKSKVEQENDALKQQLNDLMKQVAAMKDIIADAKPKSEPKPEPAKPAAAKPGRKPATAKSTK